MSVETIHEAARKKQLGQYFTDQRVGRLLAALSRAESAKTIIDPMVGSGDLLCSCLSIGARPDKLVGVELDPLALSRSHTVLDDVPGAELILGDAFSTELPTEQFDLVITNPPYIRYQSKGQVDGITMPSSQDVRNGLVRAIMERTEFSPDEQEVWLHAANGYPGTADIAVPAWILSAALVREGGVLAVVAPQAWLSRNYAHPVRELLDEAFDIDFIIEDGDATWFEDAQVLTQLVVAKRRPLRDRKDGHPVVIARATSALNTGGVLSGTMDSEKAVVSALRKVTSKRSVNVTTGLTAHIELGLSLVSSRKGTQVPARVAAALDTETDGFATRTLESYGWRVGQGFRSGANDFFYVSVVDGVVRPAARWGLRSLDLPSNCLIPAVRRQSDLGDEFRVESSALSSRIIDLRGWVTAADMKRMAPSEMQVLPPEVSRWISQVASTPLSAKNPTKLFPDLAAVATNSRFDDLGRPVRFWYQLPEFAPRHRPSLFLARVCGGRPKTFLNQSGVVVDANFSGLWPTEPDALPAEALLALLNSSWVWANLEATCTVLGGGALKIEATDLRHLALPNLAAEDTDRLIQLGSALMRDPSDQLAGAIDEVVAGSAVLGSDGSNSAAMLRTLAEQALQYRSRD
ncbi:N-6 DNA methylase [Corynebacterium sanguinis]